MGSDVRGENELSIAVPQRVDGIPSMSAIGDRLEVSRVSVTMEHPPLSAAQPLVSLFDRVDDREPVLEIISQHPLVRRDPRGVSVGVQGLDGTQEGFFAVTEVLA